MNEQMLKFVTDFAASNPDLVANLVGMINEYHGVVLEAGVDPDTLPRSKAFFGQVTELFESLETLLVEVPNG